MDDEALEQETRRKIAAARRIVVKVGSAVLSRPDGIGFDRQVVAGLARQIAAVRSLGREVVLVSSGAILAGNQALRRPAEQSSIAVKQALAAIGQVELMGHWRDIFSWHEIRVAQVLLTQDDIAHRKRFLNARHTLGQLLALGVLPVVNENDTVMVEEIKLGDNDRLSALVTNLVTADLLVLLTEVDGLYTADPRKDSRAEHVPHLSHVTALSRSWAGQAGPAGRGGMASKLEAARQASLYGLPTVIANGREPGMLEQVVGGERVGTLISPSPAPMDARKHWIAFTGAPAGSIVVDAGAAKALAHGGKSLLPSGVVSVDGKFEMGDVVEVVSKAGVLVGRGISSYSDAEVERVMGRHSGEIEGILGFKTADEIIHRDHLVVERDEDEGG
jgi:glutamate 5-kinase